MLEVFAELLQEKEAPAFAVRVTLVPLQMEGAEGEIATTRLLLTMTVAEVDAEQPLASVMVTE